MNMVERVARAISYRYRGIKWERLTSAEQALAKECARVAIEAMSEPTEYMEEVGEDSLEDGYPVRCVYRAMVDAARQ